MRRERIERIEKSLKPGRPFALLYVRTDGTCYDHAGREYPSAQAAKDNHPGCHYVVLDDAGRYV